MGSATVINNTENHRYELVEDEQVIGHAEYRLDGENVIFTHTEVDTANKGQGYGSILIQQALDDVRQQDMKAVPLCQFVARYIDSHPEYIDLVRSSP